MNNIIAFKHFIQQIVENGSELNIRGSKVKELLWANSCLINPQQPFMQFKERNLPIQYVKNEILWKLGADPFDESIKEHAKMWSSVQNSDGSFNSNYGAYWFGKQKGLHHAFLELVNDKHSRRAIIPMLSPDHIGHNVNDTVCTGYVNFHIRNDTLLMIVKMRSSDVIHGLGTDIPTFSFIMILMYALVKNIYPEVTLGLFKIDADSSHYYERHFNMVQRIVDSNYEFCENVEEMPLCDHIEATKLLACKGVVDPSWGELSKWLTS